MTIKFALKTAAIATVMAFSTASYAADTYHANDVDGANILNFEGKLMTTGVADVVVGLVPNHMVSTSASLPDYLAFCIEPTVRLQPDTTYTRNLAFDATATFGAKASLVQALFDSSYGSLSAASGTLTQAQLRQSFQLALWDAGNDDGQIYATTGSQYFVSGSWSASDVRVQAAQDMLDAARTYEANHGAQVYNLVSFTGTALVDDKTVNSQQLLSVSAVPEADTWAMLTAGLGLMGVIARRKARKQDNAA